MRRRRHGRNNVRLLLLTMLLWVMPVGAPGQIEVVPDPSGKPDFESTVSCAKCHRDIYNYWKDSLHANALEDYIFQAAFMHALKSEGDKAREICLDCHAPTSVVTNDLMMELPITTEAVTCDFCHRISSVELKEGGAKVTLTSGAEKYGPWEPSGSEDANAHPSVRLELFAKSELCATCHQWTNSHGIAIFDTYREWLNGPFSKKGVHCQNCHMPLVEGSITEKPMPGREKINSHNLSGGHSIAQVASAATVRIASVRRVSGGIHAEVEVSNVGSGHMIPTGIPTRTLVLEIQLVNAKNEVVETERHVFRRVILDKDYNELTSDADIILEGARISKDNRVPPGETVVVPFDFAASPNTDYSVKATLYYRYFPVVLKEEMINIEMASDSKGP